MKEGITLTSLNIRQSIVILLAKLVLIDVTFAVIILLLYSLILQGYQIFQINMNNLLVFACMLVIVGIFKIATSVFIVLLWLNEYYEITNENIVHKKGIFFKKSEAYDLEKIRVLDVQDSFLGEMFNFATITLYDIRLEKLLNLYLIHNPLRYAKVLKSLVPHLEIKEDRIRIPFLPSKKDLL